MVRKTTAAIAAFLAITPAHAALTPEEAQSVPLRALATKVLGEAGNAVVDVDRPRWPGQFAREGVPPLGIISFYQTPHMASGAGDWRGLCQSIVLDVSFADDGTQRSSRTHKLYGIDRTMHRAGAHATFAGLTEAERGCAALKPKADFFSATTDRDAVDAALALAALRRSPDDARRRGFAYMCRRMFVRTCAASSPPSDVANGYLTSGGWEADSADCPAPRAKRAGQGASCVQLRSVQGCFSAAALTIRFDRVGDDVVIRRADFEESHIMC